MVNPLPDSDDPFEILGLDPGGEPDARAAKRAYARLIRVYKPEKYPEEFKKIREAFELVQQMLEFGFRFEPNDTFPEDGPAAERETFAPAKGVPMDAPVPRMPHEEEPRREESAGPILAEYRECRADGDWRRAANLLEHCFGNGEFVRYVLEESRPEEREALFAELAPLRYESLRKQKHAWTVELYRARLARAARRGDLDYLRGELACVAFQKDTLEDFELNELLHKLFLTVVLFDPEGARKDCDESHFEGIYTDAGPDLGADLHSHFRELAAKYWKEFLKKRPPRLLREFFAAGPLLSAAESRRLIADMSKAMNENPRPYFNALAFLDRKGILELLALDVLPFYYEDLEEEPRVDHSRLFDDLRALDGFLDRGILLGAYGLSGMFGIIGVLIGFFYLGWWGIAVLVGGVVGYLALGAFMNGHEYRRIRYRLLSLVLSREYDPEVLADFIDTNQKQFEQIDARSDSIREDQLLLIAHRMSRVRASDRVERNVLPDRIIDEVTESAGSDTEEFERNPYAGRGTDFAGSGHDVSRTETLEYTPPPEKQKSPLSYWWVLFLIYALFKLLALAAK